jgi:hypothetical protein
MVSIDRSRHVRHCLFAGILSTALWLFLGAGELRASDGVVEINQVRALAGGVTTSDDPGFPVEIDSAGSYRLTSDLVLRDLPGAPDLGAIDVGAANVTIDLNGFSIIGPVECSGSPRVCTSTGTGIGVNMGSGGAVLNGTVRAMGDIGVRTGLGTLVRNVRALANGGAGIYLGRYAAAVDSQASFNGGPGVEIGDDGVRIERCEIRGNGGYGVVAGGGRDGALLRRNAIAANGNDGISIGNGAPAAVLSNSLYGNAGRAITGGAATGYGSNVINGNLAGEVSDGTAVAPNACDGDEVCLP